MNESSSSNTFKQEFKKRCFEFSLSILRYTGSLQITTTNRSLINQLIRSATSIGANVVEGGESISKKEFISYFQIAYKSSSETIYWLSLLKEIQKTDQVDALIDECSQIKKLLATIIINSKKNS